MIGRKNMTTEHSHLKKIAIDQLQVGMFIVNLGRSWLSHPFLRNYLTITSEKQISKMRRYGIREVFIDPQKGLDIPAPEIDLTEVLTPEDEEPESAPLPEKPGEHQETMVPAGALSSPPPGETPVSLEEVEKPESVVFWERNIGRLEKNLSSLQTPASAGGVPRVPYSQEVKSARIVHQEAEGVVRNIMHDVRLGRSIQSDRVKKAVSNMVDSILRNEDALLSLTRIRKYDEYTFVHSLDVCIFCLSMARHMSLSRDEMLDMGIGALLHDCGKMKIPLQILNKPEALSANDWVEVRKHPLYSREIMEKSPGIPERSKELALQHHERFNGAGYPFGLQGDGIGIFGQVAGIVDFYDAITADRPYRKALQPHEGIRQIYERCQVEFSGFLVERFIQCIGIYPFGTLVLLDTEEMGIVCGVNSETLLRPKVLVIYRNSKTPYAQPFLVDLVEKSDQAFKRTIIMPLDAQKWNIQVEAYLSEIRKNLNSQTSS
jgi:HD-GYP domain-containing protein (c-di-GMP phosphodiesterase class II)